MEWSFFECWFRSAPILVYIFHILNIITVRTQYTMQANSNTPFDIIIELYYPYSLI